MEIPKNLDHRAKLEFIASSFEPQVAYCQSDAEQFLALAKSNKLFKKGWVVEIPGPLYLYHNYLKRAMEANPHYVAYLDKKWVVDVSQRKWSRVFDDFKEYYKFISIVAKLSLDF